jgi:hypothetical protein
MNIECISVEAIDLTDKEIADVQDCHYVKSAGFVRGKSLLTVIYVKTISNRLQHSGLGEHCEFAIMEQSFCQVSIDTCDTDMTEKGKSVVAYVVHPWYIYLAVSHSPSEP